MGIVTGAFIKARTGALIKELDGVTSDISYWSTNLNLVE